MDREQAQNSVARAKKLAATLGLGLNDIFETRLVEFEKLLGTEDSSQG